MPTPKKDERLLDPRARLGRAVEIQVLDWLLQNSEIKNVTVLAKNFRTRRAEVDLIFEADILTNCHGEGLNTRTLIFVEIRARTEVKPNAVGTLESITAKKRARVESAAAVFLQQYRGQAKSIRFDVVGWEAGKILYFPRAWG